MAKNIEEIKKETRKLVAEITERPEDELKDESRFVEDLGIDSMMALEIVASLEKKYKIVIPEEEIPNVRSLVNVFAMLEKLIKA
ncbi:MAG: acyl carrier protein [Candidatus Omnitrophica bacterium]|jgi:acyl carrier protein|nr:acyl carrier protein [Candidatus Omnitrophota bacterium]